MADRCVFCPPKLNLEGPKTCSREAGAVLLYGSPCQIAGAFERMSTCIAVMFEQQQELITHARRQAGVELFGSERLM